MLFWSCVTVAGDTDKPHDDHMATWGSWWSPTVFMTGPAFLPSQSRPGSSPPSPSSVTRGREKFASSYLPSWHWGVSNIPILNGLLFLFETVVISACIIWWHCIASFREGERVPIFRAWSHNSIKSFGLKQTHIFEFYIFHNGSVHPQKIVFINFYGLNVPRILWPWRRMKSEKWQNKKTLLEHYWFVVTALMGNYYFQ